MSSNRIRIILTASLIALVSGAATLLLQVYGELVVFNNYYVVKFLMDGKITPKSDELFELANHLLVQKVILEQARSCLVVPPLVGAAIGWSIAQCRNPARRQTISPRV